MLILSPLFIGGCGGPNSEPVLPIDFPGAGASEYRGFGPARIDILPITALATAAGGEPVVNVYVCLVDSFDSQIKAPVTFRFELFQYVQRSTDPKGKRLKIYPDLDLTEAGVNNSHWQDFLRAYYFSLPLGRTLPAGETCVLHATCICPSGKRLWADFVVRRNSP